MAGIDIGINNLMAVYMENGLTKLVNGRPLKAISRYWRRKIAEYQSTLNSYGLKTSKKLRRMYDEVLVVKMAFLQISFAFFKNSIFRLRFSFMDSRRKSQSLRFKKFVIYLTVYLYRFILLKTVA